MSKAIALAFTALLTACIIGDTSGSGGGDGTGDGHEGGTGDGGGGTGTAVHIATNTTWTGNIQVDSSTTIDPGVAVLVAAGTVVTFKAGTSLTVAGTLDAQGTSASKITFTPGAASSFGPITVPSGGKLSFQYVTMTGAGIQTEGTGTATVVDSELSNTQGDLLVMNGGSLTVDYSNVGVDGGLDTTHCNMHFQGVEPKIHVTHSNIRGVDYGVMFYSGTNANFTYNNWSNKRNVDPTVGKVSGDFGNSYFKTDPPPTVAGITVTPTRNAMLPPCNGSNDADCAGPRP